MAIMLACKHGALQLIDNIRNVASFVALRASSRSTVPCCLSERVHACVLCVLWLSTP
jgi:hypothetical protein